MMRIAEECKKLAIFLDDYAQGDDFQKISEAAVDKLRSVATLLEGSWLTDEQIWDIWGETDQPVFGPPRQIMFARAIEAAVFAKLNKE